MRNRIAVFFLLFFSGMILHAIEINSPDESLVLNMVESKGLLTYQISRLGNEVISSSILGLRLDSADLSKDLKITDSSITQQSENYPMVFGKKSNYKMLCNEMIVSVSSNDGFLFEVIFRLFNDGAVFRYSLIGREGADFTSVTIMDELSQFRFNSDTECWLQPYMIAPKWEPSYEQPYRKCSAGVVVADVKDNYSMRKDGATDGWCFPALFKRGDDYVLLSETAVGKNYCGSHLSVNPADYSYAIQFPHPNENIGFADANPVMIEAGKTPWRVMMIGDLSTVAESTLVLDNADPLADRFNGEIPSWIKPGKSAWDWWFYGTGGIRRQKRYIDAASDFGWDYILIDAGWNFWAGEYRKVKKLVEYGKEKNIAVLLWYNSGGPHNQRAVYPRDLMHERESRRAEMKRLQELGVAGLKVDFFQSDKQARVVQYLEILEDAADFELMINFHGCTIPRGWERAWPNLMTMEGVMGTEAYGGTQFYGASALDNVVYTFTRNVIGSMDFTPVSFHDRKYILDNPETMNYSFTLAMAIAFESAWSHYPDCADDLEYGYQKVFNQYPEVKELMAKLPVAWDESILLSGDPDSHCLWARRKGDNWFIAGFNGTAADFDFELDLSFVNEGDYRLLMISSAVDGDPRSLSVSDRMVTADYFELITTPVGSGFSIMLEKK